MYADAWAVCFGRLDSLLHACVRIYVCMRDGMYGRDVMYADAMAVFLVP